MAIKTENLAIIMTDIVGFTEATTHQSRSDIDVLLDTHNRILLPIVRRYRGRHIKSIGDALLLVFRSPTDAMLCAMAMQDALYEYNRSRSDDKKIRIRVGASLGEVRVTRNDVFGEPVNLTSRVTGVTPSDEIYLSEALYMAMNKAEVPSQEVGWRELKGISQPVRIYNIPRFAQPRLVPEPMTTDDLSDLVYPYGGAHLGAEGERFSVATHLRHWRRGVTSALARRSVQAAILIVLAIPVLVLGARYANQRYAEFAAARKAEAARVAALAPPPAPRPVPVAEPKPEPKLEPETKAPEPKVEPKPAKPAPAPVAAPVPKPQTPAAPAVVEPKPTARAVERPIERPASVAQPEPAAPPSREFASRKEVESAYKSKQIPESEYRRTLKRMEFARERELGEVKRLYEAKKMSKDEYKKQVKEIEKRYD
jgi:class 3 adenylate cyclase